MPMVLFTHPRAIGPIVPSDPERAHTGEARRDILGIVPPPRILGADGDVHRSVRGRLAPLFTREALEPHRQAMAEIAERQGRDWPRGRPFQLFPRMRRIVSGGAGARTGRSAPAARRPARARRRGA